jgi:hypothetical protein
MDAAFSFELPAAVSLIVVAYSCGGVWALLEEACAQGDIALVRRLMWVFDPLDDPCGARRSRALEVACNAGHLGAARLLVHRGTSRSGDRIFRTACGLGRLEVACWAAGFFALTAEAAEPPSGEADASDVHAMRGALRGQHHGVARWLGARFGFTPATAIGAQDSDDDD